MKKQHLIGLAVALVVLVGLRYLLDRGPRTAGSLEDAGIARVLGQDFDEAAVGWLRLTGPGDDGAVWEARKGDDGWVIASAWDAPADGERLQELLDRLDGMRGEVRGEGEALAADFGVDEASAARLEIGPGPGEDAAVLLLGKAGDSPQAHFVRREGEDSIRHVARGVTSLLGLVGDSREPQPQHAVRLTLPEFPVDALTEIAADRPDVNWQLVRDPMAAPAEGGEDAGGAAADAVAWRLVEPDLGAPLREGAVTTLTGAVGRLRANEVLDPASEGCADANLTQRLRLTAGGDGRTLHLGDRLLDGDRVALKVDDGATCYGLSRWVAESLLPRASRLADLPKPLGDEAPEAAEFTRLDLTIDGSAVRLERDGEDWTLTRPERGPADAARVNRLISALRFLSWDDAASATVVPEAARAEHAVLTARAGNRSWTLRILGERPGAFDGARYASLDGAEGLPENLLGVLTGTNVEGLTPSLDELRAEPSPDDAG